mmetsp:Transcript_4483/g.7859  ORF Transcript_4483/g.7859 Transcript_4483/m.7859 type:complete len:333 (-) Transcript_4483:797-1795(-)
MDCFGFVGSYSIVGRRGLNVDVQSDSLCGLSKWKTRMNLVIPSAPRNQAEKLRELLKEPGILLMPCCFDPLSAKLVQRAGFQLTFMSGFSVAASKGLPDTGLLSYAEMRDQITEICAAVTIPLIADGDTGYGNAINVKRTVKGYSAAGAAGILIEDQVNPKRCGHTRGKSIVSRDEALSRVQAAVDARNEGSDIVIVARTDAAACESLEEAMIRAQMFYEIGAEITFVEAPTSIEDMQSVCKNTPGARLANCLEGGGDTPFLEPKILESMGYKIAAYPLSLVSASIKAMEQTLVALKNGDSNAVNQNIKTFPELREVVGFDSYYQEEDKYRL